MDGLLVIDKPSGPTSHDIVAVARRVLRERRIGHTGTLDPLATGVLPLVVGRATRLAQFLSAGQKEYRAVVRLGSTTDTGDRLGTIEGVEYPGPWPAFAVVDRALDPFRGTFLQQPPAYSAKKIDGRRSHRLARAHARNGESAVADVPRPAPVEVTTETVELISLDGPLVSLRVVCSAGFYVRALATAMGGVLGTGGHLSELRRTRSGRLTLAESVTLDALAAAEDPASVPLIGLDAMLPDMPGIALTEDGLSRALHGRELGADCVSGPWPLAPGADESSRHFRMQSPLGTLVGIAERSETPGLLHPVVVLM